MRQQLLILTILLSSSTEILCQNYPLVYENDFEQASSLADFEFTDESAWQLTTTDGGKALELFGKSDYESRVRSPFNIAVLKTVKVGNFILEAELKQTGREYDHRDMCLFFGINDATNFYYIHIASAADENAHNVFIVNDEPRININAKTTSGIDWGTGWNKIRLERDVVAGSIKLFFNDMAQPIMEANDMHFVNGYVGFGSFDDTGMIDNIKLWGEVTNSKKGLFE